MENVVLPEAEEIKSLRTERGIPETLAEMYIGSSKVEVDTKKYSLFVFDIGAMNLIHRNKNQRFGESYRFISRSPRDIKDEIEEIALRNNFSLKFREFANSLYGTWLDDKHLLDVREILGGLEKKYS